jgi:hypothetical protein
MAIIEDKKTELKNKSNKFLLLGVSLWFLTNLVMSYFSPIKGKNSDIDRVGEIIFWALISLGFISFIISLFFRFKSITQKN